MEARLLSGRGCERYYTLESGNNLKIVSEVFIADMNWIWDKEEVNETMHKWHIFRDMVNGKVPLFSDDFARGLIPDGQLLMMVHCS